MKLSSVLAKLLTVIALTFMAASQSAQAEDFVDAEDLSGLVGKYAKSIEDCSMWSADSNATSGEKSDNIVEIKRNSIEWYRSSCEIKSVKIGRTTETHFVEAQCETKGNEFEASLKIEPAGRTIFITINNIVDYTKYEWCQDY